jgi:hypothetical protein
MCYNYNTSIISYTIGMISAIFALCTNQIILGLLILSYCQMQLSEAMIWKGIDDNNIELNKKGTMFGKYLLPAHNIAIGLGILLVSKKFSLKTILPLLIGVIFFLFVVIHYYQRDSINVTYPEDRNCVDKSCQNSNNRLKWPYPHDWYRYSFIISLIILILYVNPLYSKLFLTFCFIFSFSLSFLYFRKSVVGSVWCFSTAILAPFIVIVNYYLINHNK